MPKQQPFTRVEKVSTEQKLTVTNRKARLKARALKRQSKR